MDFFKLLDEQFNIKLTDQQTKAMLHLDGPLLLLAVPGAGKTTVMVCRLANMVLNHRILPYNILTLTFSRASARDMRDRFNNLFGKFISQKMDFSTIHSFSYGVINDYTNLKGIKFPTVIENEDSEINKYNLLRQIYKQENDEIINDDKLEVLINTIGYVKNMMIKPKDFDNFDFEIEKFREVYEKYEQFKKEKKYIDYDDMLTSALIILRSNPEILAKYRSKYKYVNVDESQDTSLIQHEIIKLLVNPLNNVFMVGDEDQSIYKFRGAEPKVLLNFKETYPGAEVYLLEQNFRSTTSIINAANGFIKNNKERYEKNMQGSRDEGIPIKYFCFKDKDEQFKYILDKSCDSTFKDIAVLYRNNLSAIPLADYLDRNNKKFYLREVKTFFFNHWVTRDINAFLTLAMNENDLKAFEQVAFKINAYISKKIIELLRSSNQGSLNVFDALLTIPDISLGQRKTILKCKSTVNTMRNVSPLKAIGLIEDGIGYRNYLNDAGKRLGYSFEGLCQMISVLKSIASGTQSIPAFIDRLQELQIIMGESKKNKGRCNITLSTIHSSKGLEYDTVLLMDLFDGEFPSAGSIRNFDKGFSEDIDEEIRTFYVGMTRAKNNLELLSAKYINGNFTKVSRFVDIIMGSEAKKKDSMGNKLKKALELVNTKWKNGTSGLVKVTVDSSEFLSGVKVKHVKYGIGAITKVNEDTIEVEFEGFGTKKLSLKFCLEAGILRKVYD